MTALVEHIKNFHFTYGQGKMTWLAFSGGLDSHVLLHLYCQLRLYHPIALRIVHINHGLHPKAEEWSLHCQAICEAYQVDFISKSLNIKTGPQISLEEAARKKRYAALRAFMNEGDLLVTGHHQDDQVETLLLQLVRGAGLKGLAAMPCYYKTANTYQGRPLLIFSRELLLQYAREHQLSYLHDTSNDDTRWSRNFIRHDILPSFKKRWPSIATTVTRSISHIAEAQNLLEELAFESMEKMTGSVPNTLSIHQLKQLSSSKQRLILRTWIHALGYTLPNESKLKTIQQTVFTANPDRMPAVFWKKVIIRRYRDDLYIMPLLSHHPLSGQVWALPNSLHLPEIGILHANKVIGKGLRANIQQVSVQFRQSGEVVQIPTRGRCQLKKLFQEWGVPPWLRQHIPLIFFHEQLIAAVGYFFSHPYIAKENELGYEISLELHNR